jgi:hypothetical protein
MIGWAFWTITIFASGLLWILLESIPNCTSLDENGQKIAAFLMLTFFTTSWGKLNNPDFEFKTFFKMIFLLPRRLQWSIRISFSYLIRIKVDDYYLLVRSGKKNEKNLKDKFQPVGGVYKMISSKDVCKRFHLIDDNMKESPSDDLRKRLKKPFQIFKVLKWFHDKDGIEAAPFREFYEELIRPGILPSDLFSDSLFRKIEVKKEQIVWSEWNGINEYKIFEIYDLELNQEQLKYLRELKNKGHNDLLFLRRDDFKNSSGSITAHANKILE